MHTLKDKVSEGQAEKYFAAEGVGKQQCHFVFRDFLGTEGYKPAEDIDRRWEDLERIFHMLR